MIEAEEANKLLAAEDRSPLPHGLTFHSLRRTYAALRAELGEHPAITAAQMGHRDPRMTLRVYTDVTGMKPRTRMGGLLGDENWSPLGTSAQTTGGQEDKTPDEKEVESPQVQAQRGAGATGLEPATSGVTGRRSNQLSYAPEMARMGLVVRPGRQI